MIVLLVGMGLASCSDATRSNPLSVSSSRATGTVTGAVRLYGGPMNPATGKQALNGEPSANQLVSVQSGSRVVATVTSDSSGRFSIDLHPGTYTLGCIGPNSVTITAGRSVSLDCMMAVA
jgi:hypothetical protein